MRSKADFPFDSLNESYNTMNASFGHIRPAVIPHFDLRAIMPWFLSRKIGPRSLGDRFDWGGVQLLTGECGSTAFTWRLPMKQDPTLTRKLNEKVLQGSWEELGYQLFWNIHMTPKPGDAIDALRGLDWCFMGSTLSKMECPPSVNADGGGTLFRKDGSAIDGVYGCFPNDIDTAWGYSLGRMLALNGIWWQVLIEYQFRAENLAHLHKQSNKARHIVTPSGANLIVALMINSVHCCVPRK